MNTLGTVRCFVRPRSASCTSAPSSRSSSSIAVYSMPWLSKSALVRWQKGHHDLLYTTTFDPEMVDLISSSSEAEARMPDSEREATSAGTGGGTTARAAGNALMRNAAVPAVRRRARDSRRAAMLVG